jgi:hypothetical protein
VGYPQKPDFPDFFHTFRGGNDTVREKALLPAGAYSRTVNMRNQHPGMNSRPGQALLHTVTDGLNRVMSIFQFSKGKKTEQHLFAQMSDGDVLKATNMPPTVTTGAFGAEVFSGNVDSIPASWGNINDQLIFSNGKDQHQIWPGEAAPIVKFIVYRGAGAIPAVPTIGEDYSIEVTDDDSSNVAPIDSLSTLAAYDCLFVGVTTMPNALNWTLPAGKRNSTAAVLGIKYKRNDNTWQDVAGFTDGTATGGATMSQDGKTAFTRPTDGVPSYMFGQSLIWLQIFLSSGALDSEVEIEKVTYEAPWQGIINLWDGVPINAIEAQLYDASAATYMVYASSSVDISLLTSSDKVYFSSYDLTEGIYIDVGATPNTTAGVAINAVYYWDGSAFQTRGVLEDGTAGFTKSGWVTFARKTEMPTQFNQCQYYAYWGYFTISGGPLSDNLSIEIKTMPYFDMSELGKGICNLVWKGRAVWSFDRVPNYILISAKGQPQVLNGDDFAILEAGDGRLNPICTMRKFHNEYMVWQEERGVEGGCLTLFEGYSPATYGKLILSSRVGSFNQHTAIIVDGVTTSTRTDEEIKTIAFFISHAGACQSDGRAVRVVSDAIQNYFDPSRPECIRRGYEAKMWLKHDTAFNVIRIGLVSGASATECNAFPVYDIQDGTWSFDEPAQPLSTMEEIEAGSGNIPRLQIGGGTADGTIYRLNTGANDVNDAIDSYVQMEIDGKAQVLTLTDMILRLKAGSGACVVSIEEDGVPKDYVKTVPQYELGDAYMIRDMSAGGNIDIVDSGKIIIVNSASNQTLVLPAMTTINEGFNIMIIKLGAGRVTVTAPSGSTIDDSVTSGGTIYCADIQQARLDIIMPVAGKFVTSGTNTWTTT